MRRLFICFTQAFFLCACAPAQFQADEPQPCLQIGVEGQMLALCPHEIVDTEISYAYPRKEYYLVSGADKQEDGFRVEALDLLVSPSRRYLVVIQDGGEGHPYFYALNLDDLRNGKSPRFSQSIEAYPGFYDLRWQGDKLAFESEANLIPAEGECTNYDFGCKWNYLLNPENDQLEKVGGPVALD